MTREEIIQAISDDKLMPFIQPDHLAQIVDFVIKNYHPSLPSNLGEAAEEYAYQGIPDIMKPAFKPLADEVVKYFKAGAEWQRERMMEDAIDGIARPDDCEIWVNLKGYGYNYKDGDKIKLIIIMEEEK